MSKPLPTSNYLLPVLLAVATAVGMFLGSTFSSRQQVLTPGAEKYQKMQDIISILDQQYVDTVNDEQLFEETISDMLHKLDPHSNYIPAKELASVNESIEGQFGGIGVRFFIIRDTICVTNVVPGSPASRVDVKAGDRFISIDGKSVAGKKVTNEKVMSMLKGKPNTAVQVQLLRNKKLLTKRIVRGTIPIESVIAAYLIKPGIGYIKIDQFSVSTADEFHKAAIYLKQKGMKKVIIDLRGNGGGVLQSAIQIADEFLPAGVPLLMTKGAHVRPQTYRATSYGVLEHTPVAVLVNASSASASEILAGALQDNDRAVIVGRRTFGKGLVQEDVKLRDGSDLRLTIARYYTPTGRCIQKPYDKGYEEYVHDQMARYDSGELYAPDTTKFADSLKFRTPKGKIVYGGGGIMPDVFVPFDSVGMNWYYSDLRFSQAFTVFAFDFVQNKRSNWKSIVEFSNTFQVTDAMVSDLAKMAAKNFNVPIDPKGMHQSMKLIKQTLKAEIARQIWLEEGFFYIMNLSDNEVLKAVQALK